MAETYNVVELFAGVGGFRVGLEASGDWKIVYSNQWEPGKKKQWASDCYQAHFSDGIHTNVDIATVDILDIPDHTLLVGGFPCQDYSVAATLAQGIQGKKGVLWWEINRILEAKRPPYVLLENVDRLIKSPAKQRGRDLATILSCLNSMGYAVEWRVVNAAEYGFPQRRRRIFIFAAQIETALAQRYLDVSPSDVVTEKGFFAQTFAVASNKQLRTIPIPTDLLEITKTFFSPFSNSGFAINHLSHTADLTALMVPDGTTLGDILEQNVDEKYYIKEQDLEKWQYMKGSKNEMRKTREGYQYNYTEGAIPYPEPLDRPSRTMLTSESSKNRSTHVIKDPETGRLRLLTPVECERLDGFPDNWTNTGMPEKFRYFCMGNALVVGLIKMMGKRLSEMIQT
jgi:DNA (cytosine-5)-methyltransferase 1